MRAYNIESNYWLFIIEILKETVAWDDLHFLNCHSNWLFLENWMVVEEVDNKSGISKVTYRPVAAVNEMQWDEMEDWNYMLEV